MYAVRLPGDADEAAFRAAARRCLALRLAPADVAFAEESAPSLFPPLPDTDATAPAVSAPRAYQALLADAIGHSAADRFDLLYDLLWRIVSGARDVVANPADPVVARLSDYARAVRRDIHKMHAFLRFRPREVDGRPVHVAWYEPQHRVLKQAAPFFVDRFAAMDWLIATPAGTAAWSEGRLAFGPPAARPADADDPVLDALWTTYYRTTFDPARLRLAAMRREMPRNFWANMPETREIPAMVATAGRRVAAMKARAPDVPPGFADKIAARASPGPDGPATPLEALRGEVAACRRCPLHGPATQAVCGEGPRDAAIVFVDEQPGDQEDLSGRPFVGPAGQLFDRALAEAGIDRGGVYLTNAVKHFKYEPRGRRRIHGKPDPGEVRACRWWLDRELAALSPRLVVALGGTAAGALAGRAVSVLRERGPARFGARAGFVTVHPSFLLRLPEAARQADEYRAFVADLQAVKAAARAAAA
ncbi:UdgX family uracil-DNA binding protein [Rhodoplanes sp. TEM]|uniref:Type-4 uracil-DNA glycosylase n=1 Tax=Rhodoplanes tepidamans TaxID=200616 RepID=A0ABT5J7S8_RHOTP|nr:MULTISPECIES: UdgX family uracil-DNA binding protein [Rhodoplanes]MDC7785684.1 UdgX family uracil-DNA binding protein [Rhodoplanes tepidamans]MDC7983325.1 UdgX family uracil-DNA binding protein [Rhodoplanes sp. TEM]MDQ0354748.1 DNA polymerase [Rhodoplanes tepidamans]